MGNLGAVINETYVRDIYPDYPGYTLGQAGSAASWASEPNFSANGGGIPMTNMGGYVPNTVAAAPVAATADASSVSWWLSLLGLLILLMYGAEQLATDSDKFGNIKLTFYNVLIIGLAAIVGQSLLKVGFARLKGVPGIGGLANIVLAA